MLDNRGAYRNDTAKDFRPPFDKLGIRSIQKFSASDLGARDVTRGGVDGAEIYLLSNNATLMFLENVKTSLIDQVGGISFITTTIG